MKKSIKLLLLTVLGTWMAGSAWAEDGLYLVGGATASGWEAGEYHRSPVSMMQKDANTWIWFGKLTKGDGDAGAFKIPNQSGNWDGYWAPSAWYALEPGVEADLSTNSTGDNKFSPTEEGLYKVTINTATNKIRADKLTNVPTKDGDYYLISTVNDFVVVLGTILSNARVVINSHTISIRNVSSLKHCIVDLNQALCTIIR